MAANDPVPATKRVLSGAQAKTRTESPPPIRIGSPRRRPAASNKWTYCSESATASIDPSGLKAADQVPASRLTSNGSPIDWPSRPYTVAVPSALAATNLSPDALHDTDMVSPVPVVITATGSVS